LAVLIRERIIFRASGGCVRTNRCSGEVRVAMASQFSQDPIINVVHNSIRKGINVTLEHDCDASAVILILSAIDAMAYLTMPKDQRDVRPDDFIKWADQYIRFPGEEQLTGADLYGARCAMLHSFGAQSKMSRKGQCRVILWMTKPAPDSFQTRASVSIRHGFDRCAEGCFI